MIFLYFLLISVDFFQSLFSLAKLKDAEKFLVQVMQSINKFFVWYKNACECNMNVHLFVQIKTS